MVTQMVCGECGAVNEAGEDFCGECGTYLEWDSAVVAPEAEPVVEPEPVEEAPKSVVERVKAAVGLGTEEDAPAETAAPPETEAAAAGTAAATTTAQPTKPDKPVAAVRPGAAAPKARRRQAPPLDQPLQQGDLVCGSCGAGNKPTRKYCRRCGKDLAEAEVARVPWYRRIFRSRTKKTTEAGARPDKQKRPKRGFHLPPIAKYIAILAVLAGIAYLTMPLWTYAYEAAVDRVKNVEPASPSKFTASSFARGHRPGLVHDGATNRFWAPDTHGKATGAYVEARFSSPIRLVYLEIKTGVGQKEAQFLRHGRPTELEVTAFRKGDDPITKTFELKDSPGFQQKTLRASDVTRVRFRITKSELGNAPAATRVSIGEIVFDQRK
jgi:ribosomal protein L40E